MPQDLAASLAVAIVDLLAERAEVLERVIVAAAVQPPKRHNVRTRGAGCDFFHRFCMAFSGFVRRRQRFMASTFLCALAISTFAYLVCMFLDIDCVLNMLLVPTGLTKRMEGTRKCLMSHAMSELATLCLRDFTKVYPRLLGVQGGFKSM